MDVLLYFKRELDLVNTFCDFLKQGALPCQTHVLQEFESGHGIADIVVFGTENLLEHGVANFAKIPPRYAVIFGRGLLPNNFSALQFSDMTGVGINASVRVLNSLVKQGVLQAQGKRQYVYLETIVSPVRCIVSIEAKLRDWQRALRQAYRYREFSNQSWVLLDAGRVAPALLNLQQFIRAGIGLASINPSGDLFVHYEPVTARSFSDPRYWAACVQLTRLCLK
jgi:hypothetical protein